MSLPPVADPDEGWRRLLEHGGLVFIDDLDLWAAVDAETIAAIATRPNTFSSAVGRDRDLSSDFLLTVDPPRHSADRTIFTRAFSRALAAASAAVAADATDLASEVSLSESNPTDLCASLLEPLGARVWSRISIGAVGLSTAEVGKALAIVQRGAVPHDSFRIWEASARADSPMTSLRDEMLTSGINPRDAERYWRSLLVAMLVATADTLPGAMALCVRTWLSSTDGDPARLPSGEIELARFVDGLLRRDTPVQGLFRVAREPCTIAGTDIAEGEIVQLCWPAANQDPRSDRSSTFGVGPHRCPGASLSIAACCAAMLAVQDLGPVQLSGSVAFRSHNHIRIPTSLPVVMRPGH